MRRGYALIFMFVFLLYTGFAYLAPILMNMGHIFPAKIIYRLYSLLCHQLPYRCFFLYGSQCYYPLEKASTDGRFLSFSEAVGKSFHSVEEMKDFVGTSQMGYKTALCQRDIAIFLSLALFCLLFFVCRNQLPRLHWVIWVVLGLLPMALDGGTQMVSRMFPDWLTVRESTVLLRVATGSLFGFFTAWFLFPRLELSLKTAD